MRVSFGAQRGTTSTLAPSVAGEYWVGFAAIGAGAIGTSLLVIRFAPRSPIFLNAVHALPRASRTNLRHSIDPIDLH